MITDGFCVNTTKERRHTLSISTSTITKMDQHHQGGNDTTSHQQQQQQQQKQPMKSIAVMCISGFGGAMAGMSVSRNAHIHAHALRSSSSSLPMIWAIGCASFAGIVEFSTLVSPTAFLLRSIRGVGIGGAEGAEKAETEEENRIRRFLYWDDEATSVLGDYAMGGALAGSLFKGSQLRASGAADAAGTATSATPATAASSLEQQRVIGRGKVVTLTNKDSYYERRKQMKNSSNNKHMSKQKQIQFAIDQNNLKVEAKANVNKTAGKEAKAAAKATVEAARTAKTAMKYSAGAGTSTSIIRTGILAGLIPGISLGILAGLCQIGISRLNLIAEYYNNANVDVSDDVDDTMQAEHKEGDGGHPSDTNKNNIKPDSTNERATEIQQVNEIIKQVRAMTTVEIQQEIDLIKSRQREGRNVEDMNQNN
mmetsp:Transcript_4526/g.6634  ORF Transcript_4526/g.6634 Transcript_4526/m.6634 type:complete len:424 (-) Transcript_4526:201-1472(-)